MLRAYTRCRKDILVADKAMSLVLRMEKMKKECLLAAAEGNGQVEWKQNVAPNSKTYTMIIDGWIIKAGLKANKWRSEQRARNNTSKQRGERLPRIGAREEQDDGTKEMKKAEMILKYIHDIDCTGHNDVLATVIAYNILLSGWARLANEIRQNVPLKCEKLLHDMIALAEQGNENAAPDVISFNAVIKSWGRTKRPNSADRCEWWLRKMIHANQPHNDYRGEKNFIAKPNVQTYNLVMDAHIQLSDATRAQDMLLEMDAANDMVPNNESFSKVIRAWLTEELHQHNTHGLPGSSLEKAWKWFDDLLQREKKGEMDLGPAPDLFSSILKTAARTSARGENVLTIGQSTFRSMKASRFPPDSDLAYTWLLETVLKVLSSATREEFIMNLFKQTCQDGFLSSKFVRKLSPFSISNSSLCDEGWTASKSEEFCKELFGDPPCFPSAWSRNVKQEQHPQSSDLVPQGRARVGFKTRQASKQG